MWQRLECLGTAEKNLGKEAEEIREGYLRNEDIEIICNNGIVSTIALDTGKYSDYQGNRVGEKCIYDPRATEPGLIFLQRYSTDMEEITEENENEKKNWVTLCISAKKIILM